MMQSKRSKPLGQILLRNDGQRHQEWPYYSSIEIVAAVQAEAAVQAAVEAAAEAAVKAAGGGGEIASLLVAASVSPA